MNFTGAKHGALGAHLYLTPPGKNMSRRMRLQQIGPYGRGNEAKRNLHKNIIRTKQNNQMLKQIPSFAGNFKHPGQEAKIGFTSSTISQKKSASKAP